MFHGAAVQAHYASVDVPIHWTKTGGHRFAGASELRALLKASAWENRILKIEVAKARNEVKELAKQLKRQRKTADQHVSSLSERLEPCAANRGGVIGLDTPFTCLRAAACVLNLYRNGEPLLLFLMRGTQRWQS